MGPEQADAIVEALNQLVNVSRVIMVILGIGAGALLVRDRGK